MEGLSAIKGDKYKAVRELAHECIQLVRQIPELLSARQQLNMQTFSPNHEKKDLSEMMHNFMVENDLNPMSHESNKRLPPQ